MKFIIIIFVVMMPILTRGLETEYPCSMPSHVKPPVGIRGLIGNIHYKLTCDDGYFMLKDNEVVAESLVTCYNYLHKWFIAPPKCRPKRCFPKISLKNGSVTCSNKHLYDSKCTFKCNDGHQLVGSTSSTCESDGKVSKTGVWSNPVPECKKTELLLKKLCNDLENGGFPHGEMTCTNGSYVSSVCTYSCTDVGYSLYPERYSTTTCMTEGTWNRRKPCCTSMTIKIAHLSILQLLLHCILVPCPPNAEVDLIYLIDASMKADWDIWGVSKYVVSSLMRAFKFGKDGVQFSLVQYAEKVAKDSQLLLKDIPNNRSDRLKAIDNMTQMANASQANIGKALKHVKEIVLSTENGNRDGVRDVIIILTDGRSSGDEVKNISTELRSLGVTIISVIFSIPGVDVDFGQMLEITGNPQSKILYFAFSGWEVEFAMKIVDVICCDPCER